ncbi:MAG: hypothetical protein LBS02_01480 [Hungatella sp.]|nr:hypothetical protein [Hungatella sp.]
MCEKTFPFQDGDFINVKVALSNDLMEIFVDDEVAFNYQSYAEMPYKIGVLYKIAMWSIII